jgi:hypothetical protein
MRYVTIVLALLAILCADQGLSNDCVMVLDQSQTRQQGPDDANWSAGVSHEWLWAQTFVVGRQGKLGRVEIMVTRSTFQSDALIFAEIRRTSLGVPSDDENDRLATIIVPFDALPESTLCQWYSVDFLGHNVAVAPGDALAFVMRKPEIENQSIAWCGSFDFEGEDLYPNGGAYKKQAAGGGWTSPTITEFPADFAFRVFVCEEPVQAAGTTWGRVKASWR